MFLSCFFNFEKLVDNGIEGNYWDVVVILEDVFENVCDFVWIWCIGWREVECKRFIRMMCSLMLVFWKKGIFENECKI